MMHRISAVSGSSPTKQQEKDVVNAPSQVEVAANMPNYQLKAMKDSNSLRSVMSNIIELHSELTDLVTTHLSVRKELGKQITDINDKYIRLFENALGEMLKTQRAKFKVQQHRDFIPNLLLSLA